MAKIQKAMAVIIWLKPNETPLVLLLKRPKNKGGFWQPVTGHLEKSEDFAAAALREAIEETGLKFKQKPQYLGIHFEYEGRFGPSEEKAFALFLEGKTKPKIKLDRKEHEAYDWFTCEQALTKIDFPDQKEAICRALNPPTPFILQKNGSWLQDNEEITHARTVDLLFQNIKHQNKNFFVEVGGQQVKVIVQDAVYFVKSIDLDTGKLKLLGNIEKKLNPKTLFIGKDNIIYCKIDGERTKFLRSAYYELSKAVCEEKTKSGKVKYFLQLKGQRYPLRIAK